MALVWDASRERRDTGSGTFVVHERIAAGGMAEVFLATRRGLEGFAKPVVLKRILPEYAEDEKFCEMFVREARLGACLSHPNVVQVLDLGRDGGSLFIALEYVPGADLARWVRVRRNRGHAFDTRLACHMVHEIVAALEHAHGANGVDGEPLNVVHRDVSPHNVLVSIDGALKLGDFGIARATSLSAGEQTQTGTVKGKLSYMSPEQARGEQVDARTDLFSASVVLYELLSLQRPYGMNVDPQFILRLHAGDHVPLSEHRPDLPRSLVDLVSRGLAARPAGRFADAAEMRWELARFLSAGPPIGRAEVAAALILDLPDDVDRARGLVHRALGRAQTGEHQRTETVEVPDAELDPDRTVLVNQLERAFRRGTLLGMPGPLTGAPRDPVTASGVLPVPVSTLPSSERPTVRRSYPDDDEDEQARRRRRPWLPFAVLALFGAAVAAGVVVGTAGEAGSPATTAPVSPSPVPAERAPIASPSPVAAVPAPLVSPSPVPEVRAPIASASDVAPDSAPTAPSDGALRLEPAEGGAARATPPNRAAEPQQRARTGARSEPRATTERASGPAHVTVRAPNGWARVYLNGAGPFMAPFREREVAAGRLAVRFESPRGDQTVYRQAHAGESLVLSAP